MKYFVKLASIILAMIMVSGSAWAQFNWGKKKEEPEAVTSAPEPETPKRKLAGETLYFTEPYTFLDPPVKNELYIGLDVHYSDVKYPYGFVNTLDSSEPLIEFQKRVIVTDKEQRARAVEKSGLNIGDRFTVVSASGKAYLASVVGFSYVGNSPSTIQMAADLKLDDKDVDPSLFTRHGVALAGEHVIAEGPIKAQEPLSDDDALWNNLFNSCANGLAKGHTVAEPDYSDAAVLPAVVEKDGDMVYFVSFWERPSEEYEIDDVKLFTCTFKKVGESYSKAVAPLPFKALAVYDLDEDGKGEILGVSGDGAGVCYVYLTPDGPGYKVLKKGLCAGY